MAHQFGLNSFLGTQLSVIQNMSTVGQKNILSMHSPLFINSFPELPLQPPMSAAIFLSMSPREVMLLSTHGYHTCTSLYHLEQPQDFLVEKTTCCKCPRMLGFGCLGERERTLVDSWLKWVISRESDLQWRVHPLTRLHNALEGVLVLLVKSIFSPPFLSCTAIINWEKLTKRDFKMLNHKGP